MALSLLLVFGLILLVAARGLSYFWVNDVARLTLVDGSVILGEITDRERIPTPGEPDAVSAYRVQFKVGNRDLYGQDFRWVDEAQMAHKTFPREVTVLERWEWGNFYGVPVRFEVNGETVATGDAVWGPFRQHHERLQDIRKKLHGLEKHEVGRVNHDMESARLGIRRLERLLGADDAAQSAEFAAYQAQVARAQVEYEAILAEIHALRAQMVGPTLVLQIADGRERAIPLTDIVRAYTPNAMGVSAKAWMYVVKFWEFFWGEPRESNTEGGIFPAIFGTVLMVLVMSVAVLPIGVLAAVYLKEYAGEGFIVSALRIAVRNLAGVPSIVYGVFGLGFFVYFVGGGIDRLFFPDRLPAPTFGTGGLLWASLTLALLTLPVVIVATEEGLTSVPNSLREASYALGATRFETVWRVVVPNALPGILTGMILGIARATGEVAPLMLTGVVKLAPELPLDAAWPFVHLERKFMHLGFFIYDLGFQSPNVEAARPMVFATTLALLVVVFGLNIVGISLRNKLRARREGGVV